MARLKSGPAPGDEKRRPVNIGLVIDRSGSMAGEKLDYTRQAAQFLVQNLGSHDILSIVLYNDKVETLLYPENVQRKDAICQRIEGIKASGTTNLSGGWLEGCNLVSQKYEAARVNRVILMSDGLANRGITDQAKLVALAQQKLAEGISTTTMGLGKDFNEDLMMSIANDGGGAFYFIESPEVTPTIFHEELQGLLTLVGQNLLISLETQTHISTVNQLNAYPMQTDGRRLSYRLGDVFGDEVKTLILELNVPALTTLGQQQIATLHFEYDELTENGTQHRVWDMPVRVNVAPPESVPELANPEVKRSVMLLKAAQARAEAVQHADKGRYSDAAKILRAAAEAIQKAGIDDARIAEEGEALLKQAAEMDRGAEAYDDYSRKTMSTQAFYTMMDRHESTQVLRMREKQRTVPMSPQPTPPVTPQKTGVAPKAVKWNDKTFPLNADLIRVGRALHNEIVISTPGVSRFHCQIKREGDQLLLEDVGSTNGTLVNGSPLKGYHILNAGDEINLSGEKLIFVDTQE
ncbi:MAG: VWA domain-containing protein [Chloroflexi bacterium]|nr:VWA domain-containing protein [Chloroflexota bacterium]